MPRIEEIEFRAGRLQLAGTLTLPDADPPAPKGRYPNVLLLASYFPRDRDGSFDRGRHSDWFAPAHPDEPPGLLARIADALAERGVATLRYDKRGCGGSGGTWEEADWFGLIDDARDGIGYLRSRRDLDMSRCGIVGHGEGAAIALSVAIGDPAIGALTLIGAPARSFRDVFRRQVAARRRGANGSRQHGPLLAALDRWSEDLIERADRREPVFELPLRGAQDLLPLTLAGWHQAFQTPTLALATMLDRSVTLVHGARDTMVDEDESRLLEGIVRSGGNDARFRSIDAEHDLAEATDAEIGELADDVAARLLPRELPPVLIAIEQMG